MEKLWSNAEIVELGIESTREGETCKFSRLGSTITNQTTPPTVV